MPPSHPASKTRQCPDCWDRLDFLSNWSKIFFDRLDSNCCPTRSSSNRWTTNFWAIHRDTVVAIVCTVLAADVASSTIPDVVLRVVVVDFCAIRSFRRQRILDCRSKTDLCWTCWTSSALVDHFRCIRFRWSSLLHHYWRSPGPGRSSFLRWTRLLHMFCCWTMAAVVLNKAQNCFWSHSAWVQSVAERFFDWATTFGCWSYSAKAKVDEFVLAVHWSCWTTSEEEVEGLAKKDQGKNG